MNKAAFYYHTDSDGDTYAVSDIRSERSESGRRSLAFTVSINDGKPESSMEWVGNDLRAMRHAGHLQKHGLFGSMGRPIVHDALDEWLKWRTV